MKKAEIDEFSRLGVNALKSNNKTDWTKFHKTWVSKIVEEFYGSSFDAPIDDSIILRGSDGAREVPLLDFRNKDFSGLKLLGAKFRFICFDGADLSEADFTDGQFEQCTFDGTNFKASKLRSTFFGDCYFHNTIFNSTVLVDARILSNEMQACDLRNCKSGGINFFGTNLNGSDFSNSDLSFSSFQDTSLEGVNFRYSYMNRCAFTESNIGAAIDINDIQFEGSCALDGASLASVGPHNLSFLRGVGLSERMIEYLPSIMDTPIQYFSCFISYSSQDDDFVKRLHADLQTSGTRTWFAPEDLKTGDRFRQKIDDAIRLYDRLLLVLSKNSILSPWVEKEVEAAMERERREKRDVLFPIRLDNAVMDSTISWAADIRRTRHIADFSNWKSHDDFKAAFDRLLRDLQAQSKRRK